MVNLIRNYFRKLNMFLKKRLSISFKVILGIFIFVCVLEAFAFNYRAWVSKSGTDEIIEQYKVGSGLSMEDVDGSLEFLVTNRDEAYIEILGINQKIGYLYYDAYKSDDKEVSVDIHARDEGNADYYFLGNVHIFSEVDSSLYHYIHSYGKVQDLKLQFVCNNGERFTVNDVMLNATVPFEFQWKRVIFLFLIAIFLWILRPSSAVYQVPIYIKKEQETQKEYWKRQKQLDILLFVLISHAALLYVLVGLNHNFVSYTGEDDGLPWHHSYQRLAEALDEGRVDIDSYSGVDLSNVKNPYDRALREKEAPGAAWDTAYYKGKYYVYFGIVPELMFYYPYYKIVDKEFPTWMGIYICSVILLFGVFALLYEMIRMWFPDTPFAIYLMLSTIMAYSMGLFVIILRPDFYVIPNTTALAFTVWGLYFWIKACSLWQVELHIQAPTTKRSCKVSALIVLGALCMALVAGCRPQLVLGSFLVIPIFWTCVFPLKQQKLGKVVGRFIGLMLPYVAVAAGLMYYNFIRFGSVFEFGAKYNLTTNDVVHRGWYWGRIPSAIMMYLLKFPNVGTAFPYLKPAANESGYVGATIIEPMFGGILFLQIFLLVLFKFVAYRKQLMQKKLFGFLCMLMILGVAMAIIDAQMGGLLVRYSLDFSWLFWIPAAVIYMLWYEQSQNQGRERALCMKYLLVAGVICLVVQFLLGIINGNLLGCEPEMYFKIQELFLG